MKIAFIFDNDVFFTDKERLSEFDEGVFLKELTDEEYKMFAQARSGGDFVFNEGTEIFIVKRNYDFLNPVLDKKNKQCIEGATLDEQLSYWRNELIKADRKCREEQELFGVASKENLALKQKYMDLHMQVSHELALKQEGV